MGFSAKDLSFQSVFNANPNGEPVTTASSSSGGSFWNSGDGFAVDAAGNLYNTSGNGPFDAGYSDYADSLVKLSTTNGLALADYFTPSNAEYLGNNDLDFGSGGVLLLPATTDDAGDTVQEIVAAGKDGTIYVANTANLGAFSATSNNVIQTLTNALGAAEASAPALLQWSSLLRRSRQAPHRLHLVQRHPVDDPDLADHQQFLLSGASRRASPPPARQPPTASSGPSRRAAIRSSTRTTPTTSPTNSTTAPRPPTIATISGPTARSSPR